MRRRFDPAALFTGLILLALAAAFALHLDGELALPPDRVLRLVGGALALSLLGRLVSRLVLGPRDGRRTLPGGAADPTAPDPDAYGPYPAAAGDGDGTWTPWEPDPESSTSDDRPFQGIRDLRESARALRDTIREQQRERREEMRRHIRESREWQREQHRERWERHRERHRERRGRDSDWGPDDD
jgi:hypothetical protein